RFRPKTLPRKRYEILTCRIHVILGLGRPRLRPSHNPLRARRASFIALGPFANARCQLRSHQRAKPSKHTQQERTAKACRDLAFSFRELFFKRSAKSRRAEEPKSLTCPAERT